MMTKTTMMEIERSSTRALRWARARESRAGRISRFQDSQQQKQYIASSIRLSVGPQIHLNFAFPGSGGISMDCDARQTTTGTASLVPRWEKGRKG